MNLFQISEIKIVYNPKISPKHLPKIKSSESAHDIFRSHWDDGLKHHESFMVIFLNRTNRCIGIQKISSGGLSGTVADPKMILQTALKAHASSIILAHNHPSDDLKPSQNDIELTKKIMSGSKLLDVQTLDHLILGWETYYSFADEGLI